MVSGGHIGLRKCTNNIRNEFPIPKLCKIEPLHTFPCSLVQKLMIAQNPIWRPAAILDLWHFPGSDWWGFLGCDYWGSKGMKSAEKPFVRIFSTLNFILTGLLPLMHAYGETLFKYEDERDLQQMNNSAINKITHGINRLQRFYSKEDKRESPGLKGRFNIKTAPWWRYCVIVFLGFLLVAII